MSNSLKALMLGAGTVITMCVIGLAFYVYREASATTGAAVSKISSMSKEFSESDKTMYDGLSITGSEVINVINKFKQDGIAVKVTTKKSVSYYNWSLTEDDKTLGAASTASLTDAQSIKNSAYINQQAIFTGKILRDSNDTIIGISFVQG